MNTHSLLSIETDTNEDFLAVGKTVESCAVLNLDGLVNCQTKFAQDKIQKYPAVWMSCSGL